MVYQQKKQFKTILNKYVGGFECVRTKGDDIFKNRGSIIMDYRLLLDISDCLKLKHLNDVFVYYKHTTFHFKRG